MTGKKKNRDIYKTLFELSTLFSSSISYTRVLKTVFDTLVDLLFAEAGSLWLLDEKQQELVCVHALSPKGIDIEGYRLPMEYGIVGHCVTTKEPLVITDVRNDPRFYAQVDRESGFTTRSILCIPLIWKDNVVGALQLLNKKDPDQNFTKADLELLIPLSQNAALAIENASLYDEKLRKEYISRELQLSARLQRSLLPRSSYQAGNIRVEMISIPSYEICGDIYDLIPLGNGKFALLIADVSGKGMPAGIFATLAKGTLWTLTKHHKEPAKILEEANKVLVRGTGDKMFVTVFLCVIDSNTNIVTYATGGHNPSFLFRKNKDVISLKASGLPLGAFEKFPYEEKNVRMEPGDFLVIYTDGATECRNKNNEELGEEGFINILKTIKEGDLKERLKKITREIKKFAGKQPQHDDITIVAVQVEQES
ncbi:MAG: SpoIIE family protein phosphatase [Candidatus Eremiobacteraeota bacterium]|nr:SpoIIE family protein phosphatase [Candidatus Eremiobacteraeota bacterium]